MPRGKTAVINGAKLVRIASIPEAPKQSKWNDDIVREFAASGEEAALVEVQYVNGANPSAASQRLRDSINRQHAPVSILVRGEEVYLVRKNEKDVAEELDVEEAGDDGENGG